MRNDLKRADAGAKQLDSLATKDVTEVVLQRASDIVPKAIAWLWPWWIPAGKLVLLAGMSGVGKTTIALNLAATVTNAGSWPDGTKCEQAGNVLIYSSEDAQNDVLTPRLMAAGADLTRCFFISALSVNGKKLPFDPSRDIHELHKTVLAIGGVAMLIIDPIVNVIKGDMHRGNDVRRELQPLVDFGEIHNCSVLGITHFSKSTQEKSPLERVTGSLSFAALARMVLVVGKPDEADANRIFARAKSNIAPDNGGFSYSMEFVTVGAGIEAMRIQWVGFLEGSAKNMLGRVEQSNDNDESQNDLERLITDLLREGGGRMPAKWLRKEITDAGYSWSAANRAKDRLAVESRKEGGTLNGNWYWFLPIKLARKNSEDFEDFT